jgi:hypothetical protein
MIMMVEMSVRFGMIVRSAAPERGAQKKAALPALSSRNASLAKTLGGRNRDGAFEREASGPKSRPD